MNTPKEPTSLEEFTPDELRFNDYVKGVANYLKKCNVERLQISIFEDGTFSYSAHVRNVEL